MLAENSRERLGLTPDAKLNDADVRTMETLISCLQRSVTRRATTTPRKAPPSPARQSQTATSPAAKPPTTSSPAPKISSVSSFDHILVPPTTTINKRSLDVRVGSTTPAMWSSTSSRPRGDSVARGRSTTPWGTTQSAVLSKIPPATVSGVLGDGQSPRFDPIRPTAVAVPSSNPCSDGKYTRSLATLTRRSQQQEA